MPGHDDATRPGDSGADLTRAGGSADDLTRAAPQDADATRAALASADVNRGVPGGPAVTGVGDPHSDPAATDQGRPVTAGRYRLGATLGQGGMAVVFEAEDTNLKRPVAIKQLREALRDDAGSRDRFFAEAEILAGLEYAGVVPVHDAGLLDDGAPYYAMAKVKGSTLADLLTADRAAGLRVSMRHVEILLRAAETVGHAHGRRLIHLDLKPQNIMVDEDGAVYVMDWGIARRSTTPAAAERGVLRGTPAYMSPEVASGRADLADARSDVFAFGVMLYEVLTGQRPFRGDPEEVMRAVAGPLPPEPRRIARHVPRELSAICMKALSRDPNARYATARELARDLRDYRDFLPISALRPTLGDRIVKWVRRHPRTATAIATFVAALVVFGGVRTYRLATERAMLEAFWSDYRLIASDLERLERELAGLERSAPGPDSPPGTVRRADLARAELRQRIELRSEDARSVAAATLGLTRGQPDARLVEAVSTRLRHDVETARTRGDFVRVKVLAETRLALLEQLAGEVDWPEADKTFLRATLAEATAEIERRLASP